MTVGEVLVVDDSPQSLEIISTLLTSRGLTVRVAEREVVPHLVRLLVDRGLSVYGAAAKAPTLEDVYFAVEARIAASEGRPAPAPTADLLSTPVGSFS